jgi:hypothetical protein
MSRLVDLGRRDYPQTWLLIDAVREIPRLLGHEVVDLSPGAIELRHVANDLKRFADNPERWLAMGEKSAMERLGAEHHRTLSFGPLVSYCVEHDTRRVVHRGRPYRHLRVSRVGRALTPATSAEIGLYFYGRRPACFGIIEAETAHGFIGLNWEELTAADVQWLLGRERKARP